VIRLPFLSLLSPVVVEPRTSGATLARGTLSWSAYSRVRSCERVRPRCSSESIRSQTITRLGRSGMRPLVGGPATTPNHCLSLS
jgi:hypothetical protein